MPKSQSEIPRVAVVGAGPAGLYALRSLVRSGDPVTVDVFDLLPAPYGLVRYGVAPDHPKTRSVITVLRRSFESGADVSFFGNVLFGRDVTRADLQQHYHAIIYATGAQDDRRLGIPGEALLGSHSARDFISWYCGHPRTAGDNYSLARSSQVAVIGAGNVALDVARMLARSPEEIARTDVPNDVLEAMRASRITDIHVLARRGPADAKFTPVELRELGELSHADVDVRTDELDIDAHGMERMTTHRQTRQNMQLLREWSNREPEGKPRRIHLRFLRSPVHVVGQRAVSGLFAERNAFAKDGNIRGTETYEYFDVGLVLRAVGYAAQELPGVPFDDLTRTIPHKNGRVLGEDGEAVPGEYVTGWAKRRPTGVIGTNKQDAAEAVSSLLEDIGRLTTPAYPDTRHLKRILADRRVDFTDWSGWLRLDAYERMLGHLQSRDRVRIADLTSMLEIASGTRRTSDGLCDH